MVVLSGITIQNTIYESTHSLVCRAIKDDGQGFGAGSIPVGGGFGLIGMSE